MSESNTVELLLRRLSERLLARGMRCATAESCTGGWMAQTLTSLPGSSAWFERGFVTYSNDAKQELLEVPAQTLHHYGAVSEQTARAMALGALRRSHAQAVVAVTGIAGPDGGTPAKPVGTVVFAWVITGHEPEVETRRFAGDRAAVRWAAVVHGIAGLCDRLEDLP